MKKVEIYSTPSCQYCKMAKDWFATNNVEYTEHDVAADEAMRNQMIEKSGQMGVPVIDIEGELIVGFNEPKMKELLEI